jgi:hypothetical protein
MSVSGMRSSMSLKVISKKGGKINDDEGEDH